MALTTTTLSSAVGLTDTTIVVASATGFVANMLITIDSETMKVGQAYTSGTTIPVRRGLDGTVTATHAKTANVNVELGSDLSGGPAGQTNTQWPQQVSRRRLSYSAAGAITMPNPGEDMIAIIIGTSTLAMTLTAPTKDMDGCLLWIVSNGKGAHTVTITAGVGGGGATMDVGTYNTTEQTGCALMAMNGAWILWANGIGSSGTQVAGVVWA